MEKEDQKGAAPTTCHADPEVAAADLDSSAGIDTNLAKADKPSAEKRSLAVKKEPVNKNKKEAQTLPLQASDENISQNVLTSKEPTPRLIHSSLLRIPMQIRYVVYGGVSSALFMVLYNVAVDKLGYLYVPSTIYAVTYTVFIPIQHALASCMVFGWPDRYFVSLSSNVPIGLTAIALGSYLTAYLDKIDFDESADNMVRRLGVATGASWSSSETPTTKVPNKEGNGEFYTSLVVLIVTSFWSWLGAVLVNSPTEASEKKQL
ncbi:expressed unknown protein [Seminavis robusta]|uniref:Uncharacterized protein n=1 Tax=Seminavis robusta TaxID=568900 RepID=A0A9N8DRY0_9STRA|nr:expressed unknown protein [Seminavis robusta]|eukprot:Sro245_g097550.1 n/a (262) ;mRNA; f:73256-74146